MSTELKVIKGRYEFSKYYDDSDLPTHKECAISVVRFYGGKKKGPMIQLTIHSNINGYIQFTKKQVKKLAKVLNESFDYDKYPSE